MKRDQRIIIISLSILKNLGDCVYKTAAAAVIDGYTGAAAVASTTTTGCRCGACGDRCLQDKNIWPTGGRSTREIPVTSFHLNSNAYMRILPVCVCVCVMRTSLQYNNNYYYCRRRGSDGDPPKDKKLLFKSVQNKNKPNRFSSQIDSSTVMGKA